MKTLTVRRIDNETSQRLEGIAGQQGESVNSVILRLLRDSLGLSEPKFKQVHHDLDDLAGTWSEEEAREFDAVVQEFSQIDEAMWK